MMVDGPLAQLVERGAYNAEVRSSSLLWTIFKLGNPQQYYSIFSVS